MGRDGSYFVLFWKYDVGGEGFIDLIRKKFGSLFFKKLTFFENLTIFSGFSAPPERKKAAAGEKFGKSFFCAPCMYLIFTLHYDNKIEKTRLMQFHELWRYIILVHKCEKIPQKVFLLFYMGHKKEGHFICYWPLV